MASDPGSSSQADAGRPATLPRRFAWGRRTYVMGIVNVTPDSFSGDGVMRGDDATASALAQARQFVADGADILDIGGESTRPGGQPVAAEDEARRVVPAIRAIAQALPQVPISVDTFKAAVAEAALDAGASIVNDVWGLRADPAMAGLAARRGAGVVLMHNRSTPADPALDRRLGPRFTGAKYADLIADVSRELQALADAALAAGIARENIVLDPGIGFGKNTAQNLELLNRMDAFKALGFPILSGPSRKSFIGYTLGLPPDQRVEGTAATVAISIARGADIVRVHDVREMARVARMTDAIVRPVGLSA
ncbi:MAG: dihydropteroate synthase [Alphaproteobacteria bacterium]|nr:dihydropteroate synthase [Alphaproteobacteria bacterium]